MDQEEVLIDDDYDDGSDDGDPDYEYIIDPPSTQASSGKSEFLYFILLFYVRCLNFN